MFLGSCMKLHVVLEMFVCQRVSDVTVHDTQMLGGYRGIFEMHGELVYIETVPRITGYVILQSICIFTAQRMRR